MFKTNEDLSIYVTRGDTILFDVEAKDQNGNKYVFVSGNKIRFKVYKKRKAAEVVLEETFDVLDDTEAVQIYIPREKTRIGNPISKPETYWYEIALIVDTNLGREEQTLIGYDEDGPKVFMLFPEGDDGKEE